VGEEQPQQPLRLVAMLELGDRLDEASTGAVQQAVAQEAV